jgi:hypothetical protein
MKVFIDMEQEECLIVYTESYMKFWVPYQP